jgi:hypothetical protein
MVYVQACSHSYKKQYLSKANAIDILAQSLICKHIEPVSHKPDNTDDPLFDNNALDDINDANDLLDYPLGNDFEQTNFARFL